LPFRDASFDAVYHSHVIEHLTPRDASAFLRECVRVLKPGGAIRVATPDLEAMARTYLDRLDAALKGDPRAEADHHWMELELFDQMVRNRSGGEMLQYLQQTDIVNRKFILSRIGQEAQQFWDPMGPIDRPSLRRTISLRKLAQLSTRAWHGFISMLLYFLAGKKGMSSFREGIFRNAGEIHRWLYDRFSLAKLLDQAGLVAVKSCSATESGIPDFNTYELDVLHGTVRKPDSIFMEATKPPLTVS